MDYTTYMDHTRALCQTVVIKSEDSIRQMNDDLQLRYGELAVDAYQPSTWKYYQNICGIAHSTDQPMTVVSVDTLETIPFTPAGLAEHPETRAAYAFGTPSYAALIQRYPTQEQLVLGVLYPAVIDAAITAADGTVLAYPPSLIEPQELTLVEALTAWVQGYLARWHVRAFSLSDSLYATAHHGLMYLQLVPQLLNLRLARCKTSEAHSFHVRMYLASHGGLDRYIDQLTLSQQLFLYRNILYIERNAGKAATFDWLIERLLSARQIPIAAYSVRHTGAFDTQYRNTYHLRKTPLNTPYNTPEQTQFTLADVFAKEAPLTPGNPTYLAEYGAHIDRRCAQSRSSVVQTKVLESSMVDLTGADVVPLTTVLLDHWAYFAANGVYTAPIRFKHPTTQTAYVVDSQTAFSYLHYLVLRQHGVAFAAVPAIHMRRVRRLPKPTAADLASVVDSHLDGLAVATQLLATQPTITALRTRTAFFLCCNTLYQESVKHRFAIANTHHAYTRALLENLIHRLYTDTVVRFTESGMPLATWLDAHQLPIAPTDRDELVALIAAVFAAGTGYIATSTTSVSAVQSAMTAIFTQLSSYTIQLIREINLQPLQLINWAAIRVGDQARMSRHNYHVHTALRVIDTAGQSLATRRIDQATQRSVCATRAWHRAHAPVLLGAQSTIVSRAQQHAVGVLAPTVIRYSYPTADPATIAKTGGVGYELLATLTPDQQAQLVSLYS